MGIKITGLFDTGGGDYPLIEDIHFLGGFRISETLADRDAIPELRRKWGMLAYVLEDGTTYQLIDQSNGDLADNTNWVEYSSGGGGNSKGYTAQFTNSDITSGHLPVHHNLNAKYDVCNVTIMDNNKEKIEPDGVTFINSNTLVVDLTTAGTIQGTWSIVVVTVSNEEDQTQNTTIVENVFNGTDQTFNATTFN